MKSSKGLPPQAVAREFWKYDMETGVLTWKKIRSNRIRVGQEAGTIRKDTRNGKKYRHVVFSGYGGLCVHRIIWVWVTGHFPGEGEEIDHCDGNGLNNKWSNLRLVRGTAEQNKNMRLSVKNTSGAVGVVLDKRRNRYYAQIRADRQYYFLGYFPSFEEAVAARKFAEKKHGFHPNHGQVRPL